MGTTVFNAVCDICHEPMQLEGGYGDMGQCGRCGTRYKYGEGPMPELPQALKETIGQAIVTVKASAE